MKKTIFCLCILIALVSITACVPYEKLEYPPLLEIEANGQTEQNQIARVVTYNWNGEMTYGGPWDIAKNKDSITVQPNAIVNLIFEEEPEELNVRQHISSSKFVELEEDGNTFRVPEKPGEYVYGVSGDWREGSAVYGIKVKVE
ncbi:hypothetical protein [Saccharibacillus sp. JS10]|uniref:hypothetical protein n=1 Tax=Saccharibacillus sp. JS10 TaxID=2950552 RepID=UPI00210DC3BD|nr:hypothetical protein [Saccharibacillus sp. JS10]MCQ4085624.1 hypothetical protein [Saccharibacillus sp. JS10]